MTPVRVSSSGLSRDRFLLTYVIPAQAGTQSTLRQAFTLGGAPATYLGSRLRGNDGFMCFQGLFIAGRNPDGSPATARISR